MENLKDDTNEPICETGKDSQENSVIAKGRRQGERDGLEIQGWQMQTITFRIDKQQGPKVQLTELYSISCDKL